MCDEVPQSRIGIIDVHTNERLIELVMPAGHTLAVHAYGAGTPLVLLHGFPLDASIWKPCCQKLAASGYSVLAPDLRGFGKSSEIEKPISLADLADDVEHVRTILIGDQPYILGGLSLGGYVAFEVWKRHRDFIRALILSNTKPQADSEEAKQGRLAMADKALKESTWDAVSPMLSKLLSARTLEHDPATTELVKTMMSRVPASTVAAIQRAMAARNDFSQQLASIKIPTLIVTGSEDPISPPADNRQWGSQIPNHRIEIIPEAAHLPQVETTEKLCELISNFCRLAG